MNPFDFFFLSAIWVPQGQLFGQLMGNNLTHWMLITVQFLFWPEGHEEHRNEVASQSLANCISGIWTRNHPVMRVMLYPNWWSEIVISYYISVTYLQKMMNLGENQRETIAFTVSTREVFLQQVGLILGSIKLRFNSWMICQLLFRILVKADKCFNSWHCAC